MFWQKSAEGCVIAVRLTPKASRDTLVGIEILSDGREVLKVHVRAVPEDGKANAALIKLLSPSLAIPKSAITLDKGATSRLKVLTIKDADGTLPAKLEALILTSK